MAFIYMLSILSFFFVVIPGIALIIIGLVLRYKGKVRMRENPMGKRPSAAWKVCLIIGIILIALYVCFFFMFSPSIVVIPGIVLIIIGLVLRHKSKVQMGETPMGKRLAVAWVVCLISGTILIALFVRFSTPEIVMAFSGFY